MVLAERDKELMDRELRTPPTPRPNPRSNPQGSGTCSRRPVVVLAERDKELMDRELRRELGRHPAVEWHTRAGAPHSIADLERVNAGLAKTIILMHPELGAGDGEVWVCHLLGLMT